MITVTVKQSGNRVDVLVGEHAVFYELDHAELPSLTDYSFALWHALPHALATGRDLHIDGPVDPEVLANAARVVRAWALWCPEQFSQIRLSAAQSVTPKAMPDTLTFYSGGIDSTQMLLALGPNERTQTALTVHGMDYKLDAVDRFDSLLAMTEPLLEMLNYRRVILRTNAATIARGFHAWGMALAGHGFLLSGLFGRANLAADLNREQDMIAYPWGLNHVTNAYFRGAGFRMDVRCEDETRCLKAMQIAQNPTALQATSFCKVKEIRPKNCGNCSKCIRTKVMFAATMGRLPDIFVDPVFTADHVAGIDLGDRTERAFFFDAYLEAQTRGHLEAVPGMTARFASETAPAKPSLKKRLFGKQGKSLKAPKA